MATKTVRIYFDPSAFVDPQGTPYQIVSFNIYESDQELGTYALKANVPYDDSRDYVETNLVDDISDWFKLSWVDPLDVESELSEPVLGVVMSEIIAQVAESLGDTNREGANAKPAFSDTEYIRKIRSAHKRVNGKEEIYTLNEGDMELVILLVRVSCCYDLAYDNAKYSALNLPDGISLNKGERVEHYLNIAKQLESYYASIMSEGTGENGVISSTPSFEQIPTTRKSYFGGVRSGFKGYDL